MSARPRVTSSLTVRIAAVLACLAVAVAGATIFLAAGTTYVRESDQPLSPDGPNDNMVLDLVLTGWGRLGLLAFGTSLGLLTVLVVFWTARAYLPRRRVST